MASSLKEKLNNDYKESLKGRNETRVGVLRMLFTSLHNREIEKKGQGKDANLNDDETLEVIRKEAKKRREAIDLYQKGGRPELAEKESGELKILEEYLPPQLDEATIMKAIDEVCGDGSYTVKDFGKLMGEIIKKLKGQAEASAISVLLKRKLEK